MSRKGWLFVLLGLFLICALVTMCGLLSYVGYILLGDSDASPQAVATEVVPRPEATIPGQPTPVERRTPGESTASGTLRIAGGLPPTLDPAFVQDSTSAEYVVHLFSGLVTLDENLEVAPDLATRWDVSEDGRTYTFTLDPAATFQDGRAITTEDVVYSIERACSDELGSPIAVSYLVDIVGVDAMWLGDADHVSGLEIVDDHTLRITIDAPKAYFLAKLTYPAAFVVDRLQIASDEEGWTRHPNGSGPFVLAELGQDLIAIEANEAFYGAKPSVRRVEFVIAGGQPLAMYENDELDIVEVPPSEIERITDPENPLSRELVTGSEPSVQYLGFNVTMPPFDDPAVRQAFAHAIDREKLADLVLKGTATAAAGILPPALPDYDPAFEGLTFDPEEARARLAASRYGGAEGLPPIILTVSGTSGYMSAIDRAIIGMLEENLGIEATIEQVEWSDFLDDLNAQRYAMFSTGWIADYPDSQNFVDLLFHSTSPQNHMAYASPEVDRLVEQARVEQDPEQRTALYRQAERMIVADAPWVPLTHGAVNVLVKPDVAGYRASGAITPWLNRIVLER